MRRVGYGVSGLAIGVIMYVMFITDMPSPVVVKSNISDFPIEQVEESEFDSEEDYFVGGSVLPILEYGGYYLTQTDLNWYEDSGVVKYGKLNPMFYLSRQPVAEEELSADSGQSRDISEIDTNNDGVVTIAEAEAAGFKMPIDKDHWLYEYMVDNNSSGTVGETDSTSGKADEYIDYKATDGRGGSLHSDLQIGFDIHDKVEKEKDVFHIKKEFASDGVLPVDLENYKLSSKFGIRNDPFENVKAYHVGLDIASESISGKNIYSVLPGDVIASEFDKTGYGNYIAISHGGFETVYAHMSELSSLSVGDKVVSGDKVGFVGNTGRSTGAHLHFEVGIGGLKFNPEVFLSEVRRENNN